MRADTLAGLRSLSWALMPAFRRSGPGSWRRGEEYRPVTARGRVLEKFRELHLILTSAWGRLRDATRNITMASTRVDNPFEQSPVPVEKPFFSRA